MLSTPARISVRRQDTNSKLTTIGSRIFSKRFSTTNSKTVSGMRLAYFYSLNDDIVSLVFKSDGGILWASKNYTAMCCPTWSLRERQPVHDDIRGGPPDGVL
jgi:hypothetical protein